MDNMEATNPIAISVAIAIAVTGLVLLSLSFRVSKGVYASTLRRLDDKAWRHARQGYVESVAPSRNSGIIRDKAGKTWQFAMEVYQNADIGGFPAQGRFVQFFPARTEKSERVASFRIDPRKARSVHWKKRFSGPLDKQLCLSCGRYIVPRKMFNDKGDLVSECPFCHAEAVHPRFEDF
jgi:hypothetical protein